MQEAEIADLVARSAVGDRAAFRRLYALSAPKLFGVCLRILKSRGEAEEALQEAYVKIWRGASGWRSGSGSATGWIVAVARNQAIDVLRGRRAPSRELGEAVDLADPGPGPEAGAMAADEARRLAACLAALPDDRAAAVRAAYMEGYTYEELARRHDVPLNTMRTWLRRALISLRECLGR